MSSRPENRMGTMNVGRLLLTVSIPIMISMLVQALYNIVDSIFLANLSETALTAVSLAFPAQSMMIAVATGTGVGFNALLSKSIGEKNFERANVIGENGLFLSFVSYSLFLVLGLLFSKSYFTFQTDDPGIVRYGTQYLFLCLVLSPCIFLEISYERLLQATGKATLSMITQMTGAIVNIILDPIMIFGLFGFPRLEVIGAAVATVLGQCCGALTGYILNRKYNTEIHIRVKGFRPDRNIIGQIYRIGIPSILMQTINSVLIFGMNKILIVFTSTATAVYGIYFKLQSFIFMPVFGLNNGIVPIVAYNFGARKPDRIIKTVKLGILFATAIMAVGFCAFQFFTPQLLAIFNASEHMLDIGVPALRIISWSFLLAGFSIVCTSVFQAFGHGTLSLMVSVIRQLVVLLPVAYLLSLTGVLEYIWLSYPIAEVAGFVSCIYGMRKLWVKEMRPLRIACLKDFEE